MLSQLFVITLEALQRDGGFLATIYSLTISCVSILIFLAVVAGMWQVFEKAGQAGWKAIILIYNIWVLLEIIGRPGWWIILFFIPFVNFIIWIIVSLDLAKSFDHGWGFAIGLLILPWLFYIILGWGESQYYGPSAAS